MIDYEFADLFLDDSVDKQLVIQFDGGTITNTEIHEQQFELTESICSENVIKFGTCEASVVKFRVSNVFIPMENKVISISVSLDGNTSNPFSLGNYKVYSDVPTADKKFRDITAYDAMYDILHKDVTKWYNSVMVNELSSMSLKEFRDSFFLYLGIEQEDTHIANDAMVIKKTIESEKISGRDIITAICEINGCFGHIGYDGKFHYVVLRQMTEGLYPRTTLFPSPDIFPSAPSNAEVIMSQNYISAKYEDYLVSRIDKLQIRQGEDDVGYSYGDGINVYTVENNFLVFGKSASELEEIADNLYYVINTVWYRPSEIEAKGYPCLQVGDGIRVRTTDEIIYTYILNRTLQGIQLLKDKYVADGEKYQPQISGQISESIIQLKGKTNKLTRTLEETISEISDIEQELSTRITQNASAITLEAQRASSAEGALSSRITVNADNISLKVSKASVISEINQTAETIKIQAGRIDLVGLVNATEFTSKYATIQTLNATSASLQNLIAQKASISDLNATNATVSGKLDANQFTAQNISAMGITVSAANVTGTLTASQIDASSLHVSSANIDGGFSASKITSGLLVTERIRSNVSNASATWVEATYVSGFETGAVGSHQFKYNWITRYLLAGSFTGSGQGTITVN